MTPVEFLTARYDEREAAAKAAPGPVWCNVIERNGEPGAWRGPKARLVCLPGQPFDSLSVGDELLRAEALPLREQGAVVDHAVLNDPAYVLVDIAAKRAILEWHQNWPVLVEKQPTFDQPAMATDFSSVTESVTVRLSRQIAWLTEQEYRNRFGSEPPTGPVVRLLLQPFAEHPDYDPKWAA